MLYAVNLIFLLALSFKTFSQTNIALNKTITSSVTFTSLSYLVNGSVSDCGYTTATASTSSPITITINLGATYNIVSANIYWICAITSYTTNYVVQTSTDNSTWTDFGSLTSKASCTTDVLTGSVSAQYIRLVVKSYAGSYLMISDIVVYASETLVSGDATIGGTLTVGSILSGKITSSSAISSASLAVSGATTLSGALSLTSSNALKFSTYSGGFYMSDATWVRSYNNKGIWAGSGLLGSNAGLTIGYSGSAPSSGGAIIAGSVGIGTTAVTGYKLTVDGGIYAEEVKVVTDVPASDYVFENDYKLTALSDVEEYVKGHKHLAGVPSADEFKKNGYTLGQMDNLLLKQVEEIMLYLIELKKENERLSKEIENLKKQ